MSNNIRIRYINIEGLGEDGITCTEGTFAVEISTDSISACLFNYDTRDEFKEDLDNCKTVENFKDLIDASLSGEEVDNIMEILEEHKYVLYYGKCIRFK